MNKEKWEIKKLGEICAYFNDGNWIESKDQSADGIRLIQTGNIGNGVFLDKTEKGRFISEDTFDKLNCTEVLPNDILISRLPDPIGRSCIIPDIGVKMITAVDCTIVRLNENIINSFVVYYTKSNEYSRNINSFSTGTTRKRISRANLSKIPIPIPPLPIQEKIVSELDTLHRLKELQEQQLAELDNLAQSTFYSMFGDPIENEKGWEVKKLGEVVQPKKAIKRAMKEFQQDDKISYIDISSIDNSINQITSYTEFVFAEAPSRAQQVVQVGDIIISLVRPNLNNVAILKNHYHNGVASSGFCVLRPFLIDLNFLFYIVKNEKFRKYLSGKTAGANYPAVREDDVKSFEIILPPSNFQTQFATRIEKIEGQKELIKQSIAQTQLLIDYTMDKYFG